MTDEERERIHRSDLEKINAAADYLNAEALDIDDYHADLFDEVEIDEELLKILVRVPITADDIVK